MKYYSFKTALPYLMPAVGAAGTILVDLGLAALGAWHPGNATLATVLAAEAPTLAFLGDALRAYFKRLESDTPAA